MTSGQKLHCKLQILLISTLTLWKRFLGVFNSFLSHKWFKLSRPVNTKICNRVQLSNAGFRINLCEWIYKTFGKNAAVAKNQFHWAQNITSAVFQRVPVIEQVMYFARSPVLKYIYQELGIEVQVPSRRAHL